MTSPITYDSHSFKFNDQPFIIFSGSVHYIRQHPTTWNKIFSTFQATGLNTIETYVFWSAHDRSQDPPDFMDRNDLFGFIKAAGEAGLHVILRLGPYVCAEVSYGGFPFRLRDIPGIKFRTFNEVFMREVEAWIRMLSRELHNRCLLAPVGGPVILIQLENEYSMVSDEYGEQGGRYLQWCADLQEELNFGIPGIMCYGAAEGVVETINAFYGHEHITEHREKHADQPAIWTEAWTGWYDTWGSAHHIRSTEDLAYAAARFFACGGAGINYYMWAGGVNYGREGMYLQATSYDYDAPVDQFGRMGCKARHLGRLHAVLKKIEGCLFGEVDCLGKGIYRRGDIFFVCNDGPEKLDEVMLPFGRYDGIIQELSVHIVDNEGKCLYDTASVHPDDIVKRVLNSVECTTTQWTYCKEVIPTMTGVSDNRYVYIDDSPKEQLLMTKDTSDYGFYTTRIKGYGKKKLSFSAADIAYVYVDQKLVGSTEMPPWEDRWSNKWNSYDTDRGLDHVIDVDLDGVHELCIMTCSLGLVKGDWQLRKGVGMECEAKGLFGDIEGVERIEKWCSVGGLQWETDIENIPFIETAEAAPGWYSCNIFVQRVEECLLDFSNVGKGLFWVNGTLLGRFWDVKGVRNMNGFLDGSPIQQIGHGEATQRLYHVPPWVIGEKREEGFILCIVLFVERGVPDGPLQVIRYLAIFTINVLQLLMPSAFLPSPPFPPPSQVRYNPPRCVARPFSNPFAALLAVLNPFRSPPPLQLPEPQDDDGVTARLAARKSGVRKQAPRRTRPKKSIHTATAFGIPEQKAYELIDEASRRSVKPPNLETILPYDLQKILFDQLVPPRPQKDNEGWVGTSLKFVADAARFVNPFGGRNTAAVYAAAMAHEGDDSSQSAAAAFAAAAAIASSTSVATLDTAETAGLKAAVAAARAVADVDDANVFATTIGLTPLITAARLLPGPDKSSSLTALANLAIMLPKSRARLLQIENGSLVDTLSRVIYESGRTGWETEALVSGTHLLGSLALARGRVGREARKNMASDKELIRRLQRLAGGLKNGEPEGAARAARRALGTLGINKFVPRMPGQRGLRILCIDGGGTRAIMAFETLKELKKSTGCEIHELFDIIGGTSTGAIVAASIGIARKTVEEVEILYRDMIGKIFAKHPVNGPKMLLTRAYYDTGVLESTLKQECGKGVFIDSLAEENMNRVFVVSSIMSRNPKELHVFRNYTYPIGHESRYDGTVEAQLWEGLRASSAAPTFFSEIRVNGELHADGAIVANNPTAVALHETKCMFPGVPIELLVSVGNGAPPAFVGTDEENEKKMGWGDVVGSILASATSTEVVHHAVQDLFPPDKYFRFNPTTDSTQIDETHPETLASFVKEAQDYIITNRQDFDKVASILRPKTPTSLWGRFRDALAKELQELQNSAWDDDLYLP